jgi:signal transduction histidine kinase
MRRFSPRQSLSRKLPLLIAGLLVTAIVLFSAIAYRQLTEALYVAAGVRMQSSARLLASLFEDSGRRLRTEVEKVAADSSLRRMTVSNDSRSRVAAESALSHAAAAVPQTLAMQVNDKNGREILWVDGPTPKVSAPFKGRPNLPHPPKQTMVGAILSERGIMFYELKSPIVPKPGDTTGYVTIYKQISAANGAAIISKLIGSEASILIAHADGKVWTDLDKVLPAPPPLAASGAAQRYTRSGSEHIGTVLPIKSLDWQVLVDMPAANVLAPANRFLRNMGILAVILVLVGGIAAFVISRQITGPLEEITIAAEGISSGDYSRRVTTSRNDELGVLAQSFNIMATQVDESRHVLEDRVRERTSELETALNELHDAQESLVRREKLAMLGQLAGGVGHELRNPLGVMTNAIYYLLMVLKDAPPEVREYLGMIKTQITLSEKIIADLLDFARVKTPQVETVPVEKIVREQLERAGDMHGVKVVEKIDSGLPPLSVDRVQIGQVVFNLLTNAVQAMESKGGTLEVTAKRGHNGFVRLMVRDTGVGMTPSQLEKIFEPLFTTKARGIGLGLAVSRSLVHANGGDIFAESEAGKGSMLSVDLPVVKAAA